WSRQGGLKHNYNVRTGTRDRSRTCQFHGATMDYALLLDVFKRRNGHDGWPRQRLLHECLRLAIRDGTLAAGTRLAATRALAQELGMARNTVLYAYEQLACEGYVLPDRRGTVVADVAPGPRRSMTPT